MKTNIPYIISITPILILVFLLGFNVFIYGDNSLSGANQLALIFSAMIASIIYLIYGGEWRNILKGISNSIAKTTPAIIILLLIGSLSGTWLISGIIPSMIYYGLQILNPKIFLFATAIITAIISVSSGSSWSTIATIGIALLAIGKALGIPVGLIGGAIISGAYFGDKMSPLSDTTNLAPAMSGSNLFTHIKYMTYTTFPAFIITIIAFLLIGYSYSTEQPQNIDQLLFSITESFNITGWLFLVPILVILLIIKKIPAIPTLLIGSILGGVFAFFFQPNIVMLITNSSVLNIKIGYMAVINAMTSDISVFTNNEMINDLLKTSGMKGMLNTVWLIICAMIFSGSMESSGLLNRVAVPIIRFAKSTGDLVTATTGTCIFLNITASDQYLSIVVPGRMFANSYKEKGLAPENLSRTLEDGGTVTSVLIPWNTCGATQSAILGVSTLTYLPYCFFNLLCPIITILYAYFGIKIKKLI